MKRLLRVLWALPASSAGLLLLWSAQVSPEAAGSNLAAWARFLGIDSVPAWLNAAPSDRIATALGAALLVAGTVPFWLWLWRRRQRRHAGPKIEIVPIPPLRPVHWLIHELAKELRREHDRDVPIGEAVEELRRRAEAGTVVLWGRAGGEGLPVAIPAGYWRWWTLDKNAAVRRQPVDTVPLLRGDPGQPFHTAVSAITPP